MRLSRNQRFRLMQESEEWTCQPPGWRAGIVFLRLEDRGLVEWEQRAAGDVSTGPGAHGHRFWTRITPKGRAQIEVGG